MEKISLSVAALAAIIAMTILQACAGTAGTQCAKPTLIPSDATHATTCRLLHVSAYLDANGLQYS